jgi:tripartite-type tricarboxylate transporter receptor subunit TctC
VGISLVAGFLAAATNPVLAADQDYYKGKVLTMIIGSKPGGGTDTTARLVARFWGNLIPGKPRVLVRNKGVQVTAANEMHNTTRPDGLTVNVYADAGSLGPLRRGSKSVKYNPLQWGIVGSIDRGPSILLIRKAAMDRLNDRSKPPVTIGSVSTDRAQDAMTLFGAEAVGWNIKFVLGYPSSNQIYLAFERGEIDMFGSGTDDIIARFLKGGAAVPLAAEVARPDYPDVPTYEQVLGNKKPTGTMWKAYRTWGGGNAVDKYFATPPKTPADILRILRVSFVQTGKDPEFRKTANDTLGGGFVTISGEETFERIEGSLNIPADVHDLVRKLRAKYGLPQVSKMK